MERVKKVGDGENEWEVKVVKVRDGEGRVPYHAALVG